MSAGGAEGTGPARQGHRVAGGPSGPRGPGTASRTGRNRRRGHASDPVPDAGAPVIRAAGIQPRAVAGLSGSPPGHPPETSLPFRIVRPAGAAPPGLAGSARPRCQNATRYPGRGGTIPAGRARRASHRSGDDPDPSPADRAETRWLSPIDWQELSRRIRFGRAEGRCERCGRPHGSEGIHPGDGRWWGAERGRGRADSRRPRPSRRRGPASRHGPLAALAVTRVVLARCHPGHDPGPTAPATSPPTARAATRPPPPRAPRRAARASPPRPARTTPPPAGPGSADRFPAPAAARAPGPAPPPPPPSAPATAPGSARVPPPGPRPDRSATARGRATRARREAGARAASGRSPVRHRRARSARRGEARSHAAPPAPAAARRRRS